MVMKTDETKIAYCRKLYIEQLGRACFILVGAICAIPGSFLISQKKNHPQMQVASLVETILLLHLKRDLSILKNAKLIARNAFEKLGIVKHLQQSENSRIPRFVSHCYREINVVAHGLMSMKKAL